MTSSDAGRLAALDESLSSLPRATTTTERFAALSDLLRAAAPASSDGAGVGGVLLARCEADPAARAALTRTLSAIFRETRTLGLLAESGLPNDRGLWGETTDRLARKLLPRPRDTHDLARALTHFLPRRSGMPLLGDARPDELARLIVCFENAGLDTQPLVEATSDALLLLATRIAALGCTEAMRDRLDDATVRTSPFHRLALLTQDLLAARERGEGVDAAWDAWRTGASAVRAACASVEAHLEQAGVSLDLVFAIDTIEASLKRMEHLASVLTTPEQPARARAAALLWLELVAAWRSDSSLRALMRQNLRLLARKVIERAGRTGEHYITTSRREYFGMLLSAAGGGLLTTITAAFKMVAAGLGVPLFEQGLLFSFNYALSFVAIQHLGCTLATKQPSMTAAALAGIIRDAGPGRIEELVTHVARIVRSQLAAAVANVVCVAIGAWVFAALWTHAFGTPFLDEHEVEHVLESLNPWHTLTVFYAALTGVLLWLSSLIGGAVENWAIYRRLPLAIAEHRLGERFGAERLRRTARFIELHLSGWGGNVSLGFLLGMTPAVGGFFGLPLDVRHVTLSSGTLALALTALGAESLRDPHVVPAVIGIAVIFVLNLCVSFGLALYVALRARDVQPGDRRAFVKALGRRLVRSPMEFVFPPRSAG